MDKAIAFVLTVFLLYLFEVLLWAVLAVQVLLLALMLSLREWGMVAIIVFATTVEILSLM